MRALLLVTLVLSACTPLTDVVVRVDSADVTAADVSSIVITVSDVDGTDGGTPVYVSQALPLCASGQTSACYALPITVTLAPGSHAPSTKVRVQVDATAADGSPFSSDAALFTFTPHTSQRLDFFLSKSCRSSTCASSNEACGTAGTCTVVSARSDREPTPDLATPPPPATNVSLLSFQPGQIDSSHTTFDVPLPDAHAGDLVVLLLAFTNVDAAFATPAAWSLLGMRGQDTAVIYRFLDGTESAATYTLPAPPLGPTAPTWNVQFAEAVFRGAVAPIHASQTTIAGADNGSPATFTATLDSHGLLAPGGEIVGLFVDDNGSIYSCAFAAGGTVTYATGIFGLAAASWTTSAPPPTAMVSCNVNNPGTENDVYTFVLNPAPQ